MSRLASLAVLAVLVTGCGGNDPLQALDDPSQGATIGLNLPVDQNAIQSVTAYSSSQPYIGMTYVGSFTGVSQVVTAPAAGLVVNVDNSVNPGYYAVTIYHNARISSQLRFLQAPSVRQGDYVNPGDVIATIPSSAFGLTGVGLSVYVDGNSVASCPFSFLSQAARTAYVNHFGGAFPCLN